MKGSKLDMEVRMNTLAATRYDYMISARFGSPGEAQIKWDDYADAVGIIDDLWEVVRELTLNKIQDQLNAGDYDILTDEDVEKADE